MQSWESGIRVASEPAELDTAQFTEDEVARLLNLSQRFHDHGQSFELDLDANRLEFARWLYTHGRISEDVSADE